ncbi:OsmC family peroxiredoxin [Mucilaginibacter conchicola]|uniref:OsmC family peroxiredoxin n=1 Tax=Mucilaginibacter conchicola TaxID=2303333 RepID=A0A372NVW1_9SPHI|nr:OsmC family protein [Mucilaginibacter conchicola]RFZ94270.1 OsmC family peroxiredoxin [Mucilaginibacter conchicola]
MEELKDPVVTANARITHAKYQTIVTSDGHSLVADEPLDKGGTNTGMSPFNLLLASLASCTVITLRMYIDRKMWVVDEIAIDLELFKTDTGTFIDCKLNFEGELTQEQRKRLLTIADACPVHKILVGNVTVNNAVTV